MKLKCLVVNWGFEELFKEGETYEILSFAPNNKAVEIECCGDPTFVMLQNSIFGKFELLVA